MATGTEIRAFATEYGCTDAIALKVLTLQSQKERLMRDVDTLIGTFLLPATNNLTTKQQTALDNLNGTMMDLGA